MALFSKWDRLELALAGAVSAKCGIVVQGGAMRGIYSMAALFALQELGFGRSFHEAYGSSAGAINLAYMLAGQAKEGTEVFLNCISNLNFINFARLTKIVDIDFMVDEIVRCRKPLDVERVFASKTTLHMYCTNAVTGVAECFTNRRNDVEFLEVVRATAAMPILYGRTVALAGRTYVDGGITEYLPLLPAIADGCTDIVVISTKPPGSRRLGVGGGLRVLAEVVLSGYSRDFRRAFLDEDRTYNRVCDIVEGGAAVPCNIYPLFPSDEARLVGRTTTSRKRLLECALMARNDVRSKFGRASLFESPFEETGCS